MVSIAKLYFGKDDAETDIGKGGLLKAGFLRTQAWEETLSGRKALIIGRKGSGKSAICLMLEHSLARDRRGVLITPDEISAEEIRSFDLPGIPLEQAKELLWRYVFLVQVAKYIIRKLKTRRSRASLVLCTKLRKFLIDNGEAEDLTAVERFWRVIERLRAKLKLEAFGIGGEVSIEAPSPGIQLAEDIIQLEKAIKSAAVQTSLVKQKPFHILVDQIEKVWSEDRRADAMVVGLLSASKHVKHFFGFVELTVFLRTDIYSKLQFGDRDKFRGEEFHILWNPRHLQDLLLARARASCGPNTKTSDLWGGTFPKRIGNQGCSGFLIGRTLMRPRDIIQLANVCRDVAKTDGSRKITTQHVRKALSLYSNWKLSDLQNEWLINFPFLPDIFILFANYSYLVSRNDFEQRLGLVKADLATRYPGFKASIESDALLSLLFAIGLLGVVRNGSTCYSYQSDVDTGISVKDKEFVVHPCFRNALQCVSALEVTPFEAVDDPSASVLLSRIQREYRVGHIERARPARTLRFASYALEMLDHIQKALDKSSLPEEIAEEVRESLATMREAFGQVPEEGDLGLLFETVSRATRYLTRMAQKLEEKGLLNRKSRAMFALREAVSTLTEFRTSGLMEEYY